MRLVVLDTNVVVSAGIKPSGVPARIVDAVILGREIQTAVSPSIAIEYRRVMRYSKFGRFGFPPLWLEFLIEESLRCADGPPWPHPLPDPDDASFLRAARQTGAWLITGNVKHIPARSREGVIVRTPAEYLKVLEESRS